MKHYSMAELREFNLTHQALSRASLSQWVDMMDRGHPVMMSILKCKIWCERHNVSYDKVDVGAALEEISYEECREYEKR